MRKLGDSVELSEQIVLAEYVLSTWCLLQLVEATITP